MRAMLMFLACMTGIGCALGEEFTKMDSGDNGKKLTTYIGPTTRYSNGSEQEISGENLSVWWWWKEGVYSFIQGEQALSRNDRAEANRYFGQARSYLDYFQFKVDASKSFFEDIKQKKQDTQSTPSPQISSLDISIYSPARVERERQLILSLDINIYKQMKRIADSIAFYMNGSSVRQENDSLGAAQK